MRHPRNRLVSLLACAAVASVSLITAAPAANAVGGSCRAYPEKKTQTARPDAYRVRALCSKLEADSKARGTLIVNGDLDLHTVWFTGLNVNRFSNYTTRYEWEIGGTEAEIAPI